MRKIISDAAISRRAYWIQKICKLSGEFAEDATWLERNLNAEVQQFGPMVLVDHLRLCGEIPEPYPHDSREEKLYSKYTDTVLSETFKALGLQSLILKERGDTAGIDVFGESFSFVADSKSFRLSRTAKNQKDFKVQTMDSWKRGKPYAMLVCPIYQLPTRSSQIYQQATLRNVCIFTYSHLAMLLSFSIAKGQQQAETLMHEIFKTVEKLKSSKEASYYWLSLNRTMSNFSDVMETLWADEKQAATESIALAQQEAIDFLSREKEKIMKMTREQAIQELIDVHKIEKRAGVIRATSDNQLLSIR